MVYHVAYSVHVGTASVSYYNHCICEWVPLPILMPFTQVCFTLQYDGITLVAGVVANTGLAPRVVKYVSQEYIIWRLYTPPPLRIVAAVTVSHSGWTPFLIFMRPKFFVQFQSSYAVFWHHKRCEATCPNAKLARRRCYQATWVSTWTPMGQGHLS